MNTHSFYLTEANVFEKTLALIHNSPQNYLPTISDLYLTLGNSITTSSLTMPDHDLSTKSLMFPQLLLYRPTIADAHKSRFSRYENAHFLLIYFNIFNEKNTFSIF